MEDHADLHNKQANGSAGLAIGAKGMFTKACERCRKKKIKCDRRTPICDQCFQTNSTCVYEASKKRGPKRPRRPRLNSRVARLETLLVKNGLERIERDATQEPSLHEVSPRSLDTYADRPPSADRNSIVEDLKLFDTFGPHKRHHPSMQLPPLAEGLSLVQEFFLRFNRSLPIFEQLSFLSDVELHYDQGPEVDIAWWTITNVALTISYRLRAIGSHATGNEKYKAHGYLQNALKSVLDLVANRVDILSVQALLGTAIILQETACRRSCSILVAAAARLAQEMAMHKPEEYPPNLTQAEVEQRKRVFWILYILDWNICLHSLTPPFMSVEDVRMELPSQGPFNSQGLMDLDGSEGVDYFSLHIRLAIIQENVYRRLYTERANRQSMVERKVAIKELDEALQELKRDISVSLTSEDFKSALDGYSSIQIAVLHGIYFHCLVMIHRKLAGTLPSTIEPWRSADTTNLLLYSNHTSCILAAREFITIINAIPQRNFFHLCFRRFLHSAVSAFVTLQYNVLHNPNSSTAPTDIDLGKPFPCLLDELTSSSKNGDIFRLHTFCAELAGRSIEEYRRYEERKGVSPGYLVFEEEELYTSF